MSDFKALCLAGLIAAFGTAYYATDASRAQEQNANACVIGATSSNGSLTLTGIANGFAGETGQYRMSVTGGSTFGSTNISQGGAFEIGTNGRAETSRINLSGDGVYDARLQVSIAGETHTCSARVGDRI